MRELSDDEMAELLGYVNENPDLIKIVEIEQILRSKATGKAKND